MFESVRIRNFRIFEEFEIADLSRVNLITGLNNSGKTSLLEALFLLSGAGNPYMAVQCNVMRGIELGTGVPLITATRPTVNDIGSKELFYDLDMSRRIQIEVEHARFGRLALEITSERQHTAEIPFDSRGSVSAANIPGEPALKFRYADPAGGKSEGTMRTREEGMEISRPENEAPFPATLLSSRIGSILEDTVRLADLRKRKRGELLLEALRIVEPRLQSIEENSAGGAPMIMGDIGLSELMPLPVMGEGMTRVARLVLAVSSTPGGVVLVDEIENGLHHSRLPEVWKAIDTAAIQFDTQVFATTHSFECIRAAHESLNPDAFRLHRLEAGESAIRRVTYDPEAIGAAMKHEIEVR